MVGGAVECLRTDVEQCAQLGETENVSQQECSTGHSPQVTDQSLPGERKKCCVWRRKRGDCSEDGVDRPP